MNTIEFELKMNPRVSRFKIIQFLIDKYFMPYLLIEIEGEALSKVYVDKRLIFSLEKDE